MTRAAKLGEFLAKGSRGIVPSVTPERTFELYSVPSFESGRPEIVRGAEIGSNKQIVVPGTVLLCKINPRINRAWHVGQWSEHPKIASTEWITFPPRGDLEPKYLSYVLSQTWVRDYLAANASGVGGSLMRVKASTIEELSFPLPSVGTQRSIVAEIEKQFSRLDEAVANLQRVKANLRRYELAILSAAFEGSLVVTEAVLAAREGRRFEAGTQLLTRISRRPSTSRNCRCFVAEVDRRLSIVRGVEAEVDSNLKRAEVLRSAVLADAFTAGQVPDATKRR